MSEHHLRTKAFDCVQRYLDDGKDFSVRSEYLIEIFWNAFRVEKHNRALYLSDNEISEIWYYLCDNLEEFRSLYGSSPTMNSVYKLFMQMWAPDENAKVYFILKHGSL